MNHLHTLRPIFVEYGILLTCRDVILRMPQFSLLADYSLWGRLSTKTRKIDSPRISMIKHYHFDLLNFLYLSVDLNKGGFCHSIYFTFLEYIEDTLDVSLLYSLQSRYLRSGRPVPALSRGSIQPDTVP